MKTPQKRRYQGVFPVVPTTFKDDGSLDVESQKRCVDFMIDAGSNGLCILANFSEQFALSDDEREVLTSAIVTHVAGRVPIIVTTTHFSSRVCALRSRRGPACPAERPWRKGSMVSARDVWIAGTRPNSTPVATESATAQASAPASSVGWTARIRLAVNVSPVQLKSPTLALRITTALAASGLAPDRLEIEITEAVLIHDDESALAILHQLRAIGVRIALDDFGTGFSSLSYLKRFPFDKIKIDRCFISDIEVDGSAAIVQAVVNIAAASNMTTTAEGVETERQRDFLRQLGCTEMQGYLFSAPKPAAEVRKLIGMRAETATAVA